MVKLLVEFCVFEEKFSGIDLMMYQIYVDEFLVVIEYSDDLLEIVKDIVSQYYE